MKYIAYYDKNQNYFFYVVLKTDQIYWKFRSLLVQPLRAVTRGRILHGFAQVVVGQIGRNSDKGEPVWSVVRHHHNLLF